MTSYMKSKKSKQLKYYLRLRQYIKWIEAKPPKWKIISYIKWLNERPPRP